MKEPHFLESRFSIHFNRLAYFGSWSVETLSDPTAKALFIACRVVGFLLMVVSIAVQMIDLYFVIGNLRKVTYNLCTSVIVLGITGKVVLLYTKRNNLNELRLSLWQDSLKLNSEEDIAIQNSAYAQLRYMRFCFYVAAFVFLPVWIVSSYFSYKWGPRQLAFAGYIPISNMLDDVFYVPALSFQALAGAFTIFLVIESDLAMFSIILQMEAYYQILIKNILKLNNIYGSEGDVRREILSKAVEVNPGLKKKSGAKVLKLLIVRHLEIIQYSASFEHIFCRCMLLQVVAASFLIVMNGLELSMYLQEMSVKLFFQSGYVVLIVVDLFFICYHLSRLSTESSNVGNAAYSTVWYKMGADQRKSLYMMMIRSGRPPKITAGKLFLLNLPAYLHMLRNIYSWLMLFRQFGKK